MRDRNADVLAVSRRSNGARRGGPERDGPTRTGRTSNPSITRRHFGARRDLRSSYATRKLVTHDCPVIYALSSIARRGWIRPAEVP